MATITYRLGHFTGQVGSVRFTRGVGQTHDPDMVAYFEADPDTYDVEHDDRPHAHDDEHRAAVLAENAAALADLDDEPDDED